MKLTRRAAGAALLSVAAAPKVWAQAAYPSKPIRIVVPTGAGGITDIVARIVGQRLSERVGQPVVIDNRAGASGIIGTEVVARATPDGYTLLMVYPSHPVNPMLKKSLPYDTVADFTGVTTLTTVSLVLLVPPGLPVKNVAELIAYAKANPGKISFGSSGVGAAAHLTSELMKQVAGIQMEHVPYKGTAPALADLSAGNIQMLIDAPIGVMTHVRAGKIRGLAMFAKERVPGADEVPTIVEAGGPPIESSSWSMFLAPAGTPREIVERLSGEVAKALKEPDLRKRFAELAVIPGGTTPVGTGKFLADEVEKWRRVITTAGVKVDS